jgi:membrane-bound lytic murein transglycosylase D
MQYKIIICTLLSLFATPLFAQQRGKIVVKTSAPPPATVTVAPRPIPKVDTTVTHTVPQITKSSTPLLASNLPATITAPVAADNKKVYSHVPLAGEKSYFGDKNDFMNDFVRKYLELHYNTLGNVQGRSTTPFSVIDNVLEQKKMPKELKYLAVIESALNHNAVSSAGAVGPWQLMATTARMMGLTVTRKNDDRRDLYKSTNAAVKYLELLYSQLNDWLLVIAAYNSGPTPVQRAIERTGSRNFWDIKEYLPRETQGHVLAFIATASIFENLSKFINLGSIPVDFKFGKEEDPAPPAKDPSKNITLTTTTPNGSVVTVKKQPYTDEELKTMTIVRITDPLYLPLVAQETGIDKNLLVRWNVDYDMFIYKTYPTPFYNLRLPKDKLDVFLQKKALLTKKSKDIFAQIK